MDAHWKPGEYERQAKPLKKAVESLRKNERQQQSVKPPSIVSASNKGRPRKNRKG
jgi:hypothetical protein